jgi:protein-tyrosine phosphatase
MTALRRAGIDTVVSFLEEEEARQFDLAAEADAAKAAGLRFLSFPIPDRGVPYSAPAALSLIGNLVSALESGDSIVLHCRQGVGRSGLIAAAILVASGLKSDDAIRTVTSARGVAVPETDQQLRWLKQLPSARSVLAP